VRSVAGGAKLTQSPLPTSLTTLCGELLEIPRGAKSFWMWFFDIFTPIAATLPRDVHQLNGRNTSVMTSGIEAGPYGTRRPS
jgi:hypothetical protein